MKYLIKYTRNTLVACMLVIFLTGISSTFEKAPVFFFIVAAIAVIYITVIIIQFFIENKQFKNPKRLAI